MKIQLLFNLPEKKKGIYYFNTFPDLDEVESSFKRLPTLNVGHKKRFLNLYNSIVDEVSSDNSENKLYWYTAFALQNIWRSRFYTGLESFFRLAQFIEDNSDMKMLSLYVDEPLMVSVIRNFLSQFSHCSVKLNFWKKSKIVFSKLNYLKVFFRSMYSILGFMISHMRGGKSNRNALKGDYDVIIASVWFKNTLRQKEFKDPFFGNIKSTLDAKGVKAAFFSHIQGHVKEDFQNMREIPGVDAFSYAHVLNPLDVIKIFLKALFFQYKIPKLTIKNFQGISKLIQLDIRSSRFYLVCYGLFMERSISKLLTYNPNANVLHMYEGHSWEFGCIFSSRKYKRVCVGYQHSSILPSHVKMRTSSNNKKPMPDYIISTGDEARSILIDLWGHHSKKVLSGSVLRQVDVYNFRSRPACPPTAVNILILLQGLLSDYLVLDAIFSNLKTDVHRNIFIRNHPASPLIINYGTLNKKNTRITVAESKVESLYEDVLRADIVIYSGTTAALEAVALGVPALHVDLGETLSTDPLFRFNALSSNASSGDDIIAVLDSLLEKVGANYSELSDLSRKYYENYFSNRPGLVAEKFIEAVKN